MNRLSSHFWLYELTITEQRLDNTPPPEIEHNLQMLCLELLEPIRTILFKPMVITSGYRSPAVNKAVGGSDTSEHMDGRAADFRVVGQRPLAVCKAIELYADELRFNQLIWEFDRWTHISIPRAGEEPKREILTFKFGPDGKVLRFKGLVP